MGKVVLFWTLKTTFRSKLQIMKWYVHDANMKPYKCTANAKLWAFLFLHKSYGNVYAKRHHQPECMLISNLFSIECNWMAWRSWLAVSVGTGREDRRHWCNVLKLGPTLALTLFSGLMLLFVVCCCLFLFVVYCCVIVCLHRARR